MESENWVDRSEYPFQTKRAVVEKHTMSYVDEGEGEAILFVHGTPAWSFVYRKVIAAMKGYRRIAPDHFGFGLSEKPSHFDYTPAAHSRRLEQFVENLGLKSFHLVVHDFGGPIGLGAAISDPGKVKSITVLNSWIGSLEKMDHFAKPSKIIASPLGRFLYLRLNFSVNVLLKSAFYDKSLLTSKVFKQYKKAMGPSGRKAAYALAEAIMGESDWYDGLWEERQKLEEIPMQIVWGMEDKLLPATLLLPHWQSGFPAASLHEVPKCGHFIQEEKPAELAERLTRFIENK